MIADGVIARSLMTGGAVAIGAAAGYAARPGWLAATLAASVAMTASLIAWLIADRMQIRRLQRWLATAEGPLPSMSAALAELGYRIERALRVRASEVEVERQRLSHFLSAIQAAPSGVLLLDGDDAIQWFNAAAARHFGLDAQRDHGQRVTNLIRTPAFVAYLQAQREDAVSLPGPSEGTVIGVVLRRYAATMRIVVSHDITERVRRDTTRRDFVANVSHEIRSPLTVLAGFIDTMSRVPLTDVERKRVLDLMAQQTRRMENLVTDLLALARIESAPPPMAEQWVALDRVMRLLEADAEALSKGRHRVNFRAPVGVELDGNETELVSAMWNLVSNALRYTPDGGTIDVQWHSTASGGEFRVADTGIGIAREHIARLTERFYRVDGSRSRESGGTGLGLAIVKHVVQRHGGELHIDSQPGKGSVFRFTLPVPRVRTRGATVAAPHAAVQG